MLSSIINKSRQTLARLVTAATILTPVSACHFVEGALEECVGVSRSKIYQFQTKEGDSLDDYLKEGFIRTNFVFDNYPTNDWRPCDTSLAKKRKSLVVGDKKTGKETTNKIYLEVIKGLNGFKTDSEVEDAIASGTEILLPADFKSQAGKNTSGNYGHPKYRDFVGFATVTTTEFSRNSEKPEFKSLVYQVRRETMPSLTINYQETETPNVSETTVPSIQEPTTSNPQAPAKPTPIETRHYVARDAVSETDFTYRGSTCNGEFALYTTTVARSQQVGNTNAQQAREISASFDLWDRKFRANSCQTTGYTNIQRVRTFDCNELVKQTNLGLGETVYVACRPKPANNSQ